jgi:hypothetical protein
MVNRPWIFDRFNSWVKYAEYEADMHTDVKAFQIKNKLFIKYIDEKKLDHIPNCKKAVEDVGMNFHWKKW